MYYYFVEERIKKAVDEGEFDNLPGQGKPLDFTDELPGLSSELKMAYKVLKNAGYLDESVEENKDRVTFKDLYQCATGEKEKNYQKQVEFHEFVKKQKLYKNRKFQEYAHKIFKRFS